MADITTSGVQAADTDYRFLAMTDRFIDRVEAMADTFVNLMSRAMGNETIQLQGLGTLNYQWLGAFSQLQPAITAAAINRLGASETDEVIGLLKEGLALSNSASPPVPAYQNLGPGYPGGMGGGIMLPKGSVITIPSS